jgi:NADH-quinone oxidoreductase subunit J
MVIFFALVAALSATSGLGVVINRRPLYSALSLVVNMLSLALLFLILSAQFLAAAQVIVYAGAVMVLFVFVIALLNPLREDSLASAPAQVGVAVAVAGALVALSAVLFLSATHVRDVGSALSAGAAGFGSIQAMAASLYRDFGYAFEITSVLLVVAAVGAVYLSRGK